MYLCLEVVENLLVRVRAIHRAIDVLAVDVDADVLVALGVRGVERADGGDDVLAAGLREHLGDDFEGLRELHDGVLVHAGQRVAEVLDLLGHLNLCRARPGNLTKTCARK